MKKHAKQPDSPLTATLVVLGGRWKVFILQQLVQGTRRFGELRKAIPAVTQKMLTQELRELEEAGLIERQAYLQVPPRVDYTLTPHGLSLAPVLWALEEWGYQHQQYLAEVAAETSADAVPKPDAAAAPPTPDAAPSSAEAEGEAEAEGGPARTGGVSQQDLTAAIRAAAM